MTKSEFILSLSEALTNMPGQARERVLEYFEEMIDDRTENGMSEEEAVTALGSIEEILKEIAPEALNKTQYVESNTVRRNNKYIILHEPIKTLIANSACADMTVLSKELPDDMTARIDYNLSKDAECICTLENGQLEVRYKKTEQRSFSLFSIFNNICESITITLNNPALVQGKIGSSSGDLSLSGLVFTDSLDAGTASGDLEARDIAVQCVCKLHAASGDVTGNNLTCGELLEIHTASGDLEIQGVRAGKIAADAASGDVKLTKVESDETLCDTASGDVRIHNCKTGEIHVNAASGDVTVLNAECASSIELHSANGDITLRESACEGEIRLSSTNGDIKGSLFPAGEYHYSARSRVGDVKLPHTNGSRPVQIQTTTGDIIFREEACEPNSYHPDSPH